MAAWRRLRYEKKLELPINRKSTNSLTLIFINLLIIYFKNNWGHSQGETFLLESLQMFTGPVGMVLAKIWKQGVQTEVS